MKVNEPDMNGTYTYADYLTWRWDQMVELIHGKIYKMSPAPRSIHQLVLGELHLQIGNYLKGGSKNSIFFFEKKICSEEAC